MKTPNLEFLCSNMTFKTLNLNFNGGCESKKEEKGEEVRRRRRRRQGEAGMVMDRDGNVSMRLCRNVPAAWWRDCAIWWRDGGEMVKGGWEVND